MHGFKDTSETLALVSIVTQRPLSIFENDMTTSTEALNAEVLKRALREQLTLSESGSFAAVEVVDIVDSTNAQLLSEAAGSDAHFLIARQQTAGVGRRGGTWQSPPSGNLYLSYCFHTSQPLSVVSLLPLTFGVEIARELESTLGICIQLKWPNDLYLDGKKCGGMLLETKTMQDGVTAVVVGVGVNVASHPNEELLGRPVTALQSIRQEPVVLEDVALAVMRAIITVSDLPSADITNSLRRQWPERDFLLNKEVCVSQSAGIDVRGVAKGVAEDGGLKVDCGGRMEVFYAGEVSLGHVGS
jgi:BirA family biotin operon repressor/biotin-[acetyl-CoA-carboxylase] ligase